MEEVKDIVELGETALGTNVQERRVATVTGMTGKKGLLIGASVVSGVWLGVEAYKAIKAWRKKKKSETTSETEAKATK